ncbi:MAG: DEAD/DEAH box helicase [Deltaproteobacteria bacterium]|nr:DEAD/DEAH box helicase [Deltaproteobacteria bacterium]
MKYAPLPWVHLAEALRPSIRRLRIVLEKPAFKSERTFVRLYDGPRSEHITDARALLEGKNPMSARERAALDILREAGPSHAKKGRFALTRAQVGRLLAFATDVALEVEDEGGINLVPNAARIAGRVTEDEELGMCLVYEAVDHEGDAITDPDVVGDRVAYLLDKKLKMHRIQPVLLPEEARALLGSEALLLDGLTTDEGEAAFQAVVGLGVDLADLVEVARPSDPEPRYILRALLSADGVDEVSLRVHLVTELGDGKRTDEVEVTARGAIPPVHALEDEETNEDTPCSFVARPTNKEEEARRALFDLGLHAAGNHRGFAAGGEGALDMLVKLAAREGIPEFVEIDADTLPSIVRLPDVPRLSVSRLEDDGRGLLSVRLDIGEEARALAIEFSDVVKSAMKGRQSLLLDEDAVLGFSKNAGQSLELISDALELPSADAAREIGTAELALLVAALGGKVDLDADDEVKARIQAFFENTDDIDRVIPKTVTATLRPYQIDGVAWLNRLHRLGLGRILADDMGLGKTLMAMSLLAKAKEDIGHKPNLVVAPTSVLDVWVSEARKHVPDLKVLKWHGRERTGLKEKAQDVDIIVTSYALLRRDVETDLGEVDFRYLMLDEAQHVKNPSTEAWKAARQVRCDQRLALTGTPIENRVEELWAILELVAPGLLGTAKNFERRYGKPVAKGDRARLDELRKRTKPVVLRRKKEDVAKDLPPKIETVLRCEMEKGQRGLYLRVLAEVQEDIQKALQVHTKGRARAPILAALMRLRQVCCDPRLVLGEKGEGMGSAKLAAFEEVITECMNSGRRVIVFSQFVEMQKLIHKSLEKVGVKDALWLHGGTRKRGEVVESFQDENGPPVIVVSLKAGGTGITLTRADTVIHYDPWWNPAVEDQATDRAHRMGQKKTVHVIKLACEDSIEEKMLQINEGKRAAAEAVLGKDGIGPKSLTLTEIEQLITDEVERGF